ncbi:MAG: hypothetical protein ACI9EF_000420, partial [Pseudohongiellaceae bacterium]
MNFFFPRRHDSSSRPAPLPNPASWSALVLLAVLLLVASTACAPDDDFAAQPGSHLVLISIDTLRADHLSCYGYERDTSPNIDAFAQESLRYEDVLACSSSTAPSHMSIMTGVLP